MPPPDFPYVTVRERIILEGEFISDFIEFKSGSGGYTYGMRLYGVDGTATSSDYGVIEGVVAEGAYPTAILDSYSYYAFNDDLIEGEEQFYLIQYDIDQSGRLWDYDLIIINIIDTTSRTVFLDVDGDGDADSVEVNIYNYRNYLNEFAQRAQELQEAERAVLSFIDENRAEIGRLEQAKLVELSDAFDAVDLSTRSKFDTISEVHSTLEKIDQGTQSVSEFFDDPNLLNGAQAGVDALNAALEAAVIKKAVKAVVGYDIPGLVLDGISTELQLFEIDQQIRHLQEEIDVFETQTLPGLDDSRDAFREASDAVISTVFGVPPEPTQQLDRNEYRIPTEGIQISSANLTLQDDVFMNISSDIDLLRLDGVGSSYISMGDGFRAVQIDATLAEVVTLGNGQSEKFLLGTDNISVSLNNVDRVILNDGYIAFDLDGDGGAAFRLYQAGFDRLPDPEGLGFWIDLLDRDIVSLAEMANYFLDSPEFISLYGQVQSLSNEEYLTVLYDNILDRVPDGDGFSFWLNALENGYDRSSTLADFSESIENQNGTLGLIDDGIWYL